MALEAMTHTLRSTYGANTTLSHHGHQWRGDLPHGTPQQKSQGLESFHNMGDFDMALSKSQANEMSN
jgi:hypothetical protein